MLRHMSLPIVPSLHASIAAVVFVVVVAVVAAMFARRLELTSRAHNMSAQLRCALCLPQQVAAAAAATGASFVLFTV